MPNWVQNTMTVSADYINRIVNNENRVDFDLTYPMPKELDVTDGSTNKIAVYYYLSHRDNIHYSAVATDPEFIRYIERDLELMDSSTNDTAKILDTAKKYQDRLTRYIDRFNEDTRDEEIEKLYNEGKTLISNIQKYGAPTWYDWRTKNWGCKWNASSYDINFDEKTNTYTLHFNTPWSPPDGWLENLAVNHHIPFHLYWLEEQGYRGIFDSDGTNLTSEDLEPLFDEDNEEDEDNNE